MLDKFFNFLWQFFMLLGAFHSFKRPNIELIIQPSDHTEDYLPKGSFRLPLSNMLQKRSGSVYRMETDIPFVY